MKYANGDEYDGNWEHGKKFGYGEYTWKEDGTCCKGQWLNDKMNGNFDCYTKDGVLFLKGEFKDDKLVDKFE